MSPPRCLIYAQYLKGIGHVMRATRIAEHLAAAGLDVTLVLGGPVLPGFAVAGVAIEHLPPVTAAATSYSTLLTADGAVASDAYLADRRACLLAVYGRVQPDILITEAFPMGRWAMQFELQPLLERASTGRPRPLVLASVRDILQMPKSADKVALSVALYARYYDGMLVHGDPALVRIEESFPPVGPFLGSVHYTGLVVPALAPGSDAGGAGEAFDVVVSGGGGVVAHAVLAAAIEAKAATSLAEARWLALAGPRMPDDAFSALAEAAVPAGVDLERFRPGLAGLMRAAKLSIQRSGYNTAADLLEAGCRAVLIPDAANRQMEQTLRAARLEQLGLGVVVAEADLNAATLATAIERALTLPPAAVALDLGGAAHTAEIVMRLWAHHEAGEDARKRR